MSVGVLGVHVMYTVLLSESCQILFVTFEPFKGMDNSQSVSICFT